MIRVSSTYIGHKHFMVAGPFTDMEDFHEWEDLHWDRFRLGTKVNPVIVTHNYNGLEYFITYEFSTKAEGKP